MSSVRLYQDYRAAIGFLDERSIHARVRHRRRKVASLFNASARKSPGSAAVSRHALSRLPEPHLLRDRHRLARREPRRTMRCAGCRSKGVWQWQLTPALGVERAWRMARSRRRTRTQRRDSSISRSDSYQRRFPARPTSRCSSPYGAGIVHDTRSDPRLPEDGADGRRRRSAGSLHPTCRALSFTRLTFDVRGYQSRAVASEVCSPHAGWSQPI